MLVKRIEREDGTLERLEFVHEEEADFKLAIKDWLNANYSAMSYVEFFDRLEEYRLGLCRIYML